MPALEKGATVLIVAPGHSLRALVMHLEHLSPQHIVALNIPTGAIFVYSVGDHGALVRLDTYETLRAREQP
jgi:bisphosphoglycerate-dependent phosphoglycerate mutase